MRESRARRAWWRLDRSIRVRVRIYALIFLGTAVVTVVDTVGIGGSAVVPVLACFAGGAVAGVVVSRMFALSWDESSGTVVGRIDVIGAVILVAYLLLSIFRSTIVGLWFDAAVAGVAGLALLSGLMFGQVAGTRRGIRRVFELLVRGR